MGLYARIAGTDGPKIAVWPIMLDFTRVLDGEITMQQLAQIQSLDASETAEAGEYLTAIGATLTEQVALRRKMLQMDTRTDLTTEEATAAEAQIVWDVRGMVDNRLRYLLLRAEQGKIDEATLRASLGLE